MRKALKLLLAVAIAGIALQVANHVVVRGNLCGVGGVVCTSGFGGVEGQWQGAESLPSGVRGAVVGFTAATELIRKKCDGGWTAGLGARIDVGPFAFRDSFSGGGACVEAGRAAVSGELTGVRLRSAQCTLALAPLRLDWDETLRIEAATAFDADAVAGCGELVSTSSAVAEALSGARLALAADYGVAYGDSEPAQGGSAPPAMASSWIRSALGATSVAHTLTFVGPNGTATLRLASTPSAGARSPELTFELTADEGVRAALPPEVRGYLNEAGKLEVRWNLDHENGYVIVDGARI
jgi:hypothetical protein